MSAGAFCYLVFVGICVGVATYVYFVIPETKDKTFVEISQMFASRNNCELEGEQLPITEHLDLKVKNRYGAMEKGKEEMSMWSDDEWMSWYRNKRLLYIFIMWIICCWTINMSCFFVKILRTERIMRVPSCNILL